MGYTKKQQRLLSGILLLIGTLSIGFVYFNQKPIAELVYKYTNKTKFITQSLAKDTTEQVSKEEDGLINPEESNENLNASEETFNIFKPEVLPNLPTVVVTDRTINPMTITIVKGNAVLFVNKATRPIQIQSEPHSAHTSYQEFNMQQAMEPDYAYTFTFDKTGIFRYHTENNLNLRGEIIVTEN